MGEVKTARGVYKDLTVSPYEYKAPYGELFKFPSQKKLEMYTRDIETELDRITKAVDRLQLREFLAPWVLQHIRVATYKALYRKIVG